MAKPREYQSYFRAVAGHAVPAFIAHARGALALVVIALGHTVAGARFPAASLRNLEINNVET